MGALRPTRTLRHCGSPDKAVANPRRTVRQVPHPVGEAVSVSHRWHTRGHILQTVDRPYLARHQFL